MSFSKPQIRFSRAGSKPRCQVLGVRCQVPGSKFQVSGSRCQVPGARYQVSQVAGVRFHMPDSRFHFSRYHVSGNIADRDIAEINCRWISSKNVISSWLYDFGKSLYLQLRLASLHLDSQKQPLTSVLIKKCSENI